MFIFHSYGRRNAFLPSAFISVVLMVASPFSPNYWVYASFRFFIGLALGGVLAVGVVIILEVVAPQHRDIAGLSFKPLKAAASTNIGTFAIVFLNRTFSDVPTKQPIDWKRWK